MKKTTTNRLNMYLNVQSVMVNFQAVWQDIPAFSNSMTRFNSKVGLLQNRLVEQSSVTTGVSIEKHLHVDKLRKQMLMVQRALLLYGRAIENVSLEQRNSKGKSSLMALSVNGLAVRAAELKLDLEQYGSQLADYGISPATIANIIPLLVSVNDVNNATRRAIIERTKATESIKELERELNALVRIELDGLMLVFEMDQPDFYKSYNKARMVIHYHGSKTPPQPDDGKMAS